MRIRPILLASLALLCSACMSRIDFRSGEDENVLIVNARFYTDETHHGIQVDMSTLRESTSTVTDADVDVFINGRYHSRAEFYTPVFDGLVTRAVVSYDPILLPTGDYERRPGYYFDAELHPGDEIRVEVTRGDLHASASATVPDAVELVSVDTLRVRENPYTANADVLKCVARIRDVPGERNWMRIANIDHFDVMAHYGPGPEGDTLTTWYTHTARMYFDDDPILRGDFHSSREQAAIRETGLNLPLVTNSYCIFTDSGFADSEHTAEIYMNGSFNYRPDYGWPVPRTMNSSLTIRLLTMSHDEYLYMLSYTNAETNGLLNSGDILAQVLFEPVTFPSNVEGGLGFVCADAVSAVRIDFPQKYIPAETIDQQ